MVDRRLLLARLLMRAGVREPWIGSPLDSLLVVNYHRLWPARDVRASEFDDGVFGPDVAEFRRQMEWLRTNTTVLGEEDLLAVIDGPRGPGGAVYSVVTFDDAYIDCYSLARPVLDDLGIRAIFFAPIEMIDSRQLGWWDLAAYLLKKARQSSIRVVNEEFDVRNDYHGSLGRVLNLFKLKPAAETDDLLEQLAEVCGVPLPAKDVQSRQLMTWEQMREMRASGHGIGSHTFSHRVLATLSADGQAHEIKDSRRELEARIGGDVWSLAYPVGGPKHINEHSVELARAAGYAQAFTFNTGIASLPLADRFRIPREPVHSLDLLRAKALMPRLMGMRDKLTA